MYNTSEIEVLDTTLRDGTQMRGVNFTLQEKIRIATKLDDLGVSIIEGGWPGSNPKDLEFFKLIRKYELKNSKIAVFGSTRRKNITAINDNNLKVMVDSEAPVSVIVGKTSSFHVEKILNCSLEDNLDMIYDSLMFLRENGMETYFDAEHFFDGYNINPEYAIQTVKTAKEAKVNTIVLCDTNGGMLPHQIEKIVKGVKENSGIKIGFHGHNDTGCAVANTISSVVAGATHIQGTINGVGERTGNADLCQVIPNLEMKLKKKTRNIQKKPIINFGKLRDISNYINELANINPFDHQPYFGKFAFSHKAGLHVDGMLKASEAYEHIDPKIFDSERSFTVSELSGKANIMALSKKFNLEIKKDDRRIMDILEEIKKLEFLGFTLDNADATTYLIFLRHLGLYKQYFHVDSWKVLTEKQDQINSKSEIEITIGNARYKDNAYGVGPVNSLTIALRKSLQNKYPEINQVELTNYKVSIVGASKDTASLVRVFIEFEKDGIVWATTATSQNILDASLRALIDGHDYFLQKNI